MTEEKLQKQVDELDHQIKELVASNKLLTEAFYAKYPDQKIDTTEKPLQDQTVVRDDTTTRRTEVQKFTKEPGYVSHPPVRDYVKIIEEREPKRLRAIGRSIVRYIEKANKYKAVHEEAEKKCLELDQEPAPPTEE